MAKPTERQSGKPGEYSSRPEEHTPNSPAGIGRLDTSIVQSLPIAIVAFERDLRIVEANPQAAKLIELGQYVDKSLAKGTDAPRAPGGDKVWPGWTKQLKKVLSTEKTRTFDNVGYTTGGQKRLLRIVCAPVKNERTGKVLGGTIIIEDVTEKARMQRQLADAERLAAVGTVASKVAHELNNPLDGILRYINLAMRIIEQEKLEKPREYLAQCRQGLMRMIQIVSELLEFSRSTYARFEYVQLEQLIEDAVKTMESRTETLNVRIVRNYGGDIPEIRSGNLFQVFCNLAKNALDAMPEGGQLRISTRIEDDNTAVVEFRDTGIGFAPENAEVIFEPFFTTKDKGEGTGLGLAICRDIVESCHGRITAENAPEGGSIFTVYLPAAGNIRKNL